MVEQLQRKKDWSVSQKLIPCRKVWKLWKMMIELTRMAVYKSYGGAVGSELLEHIIYPASHLMAEDHFTHFSHVRELAYSFIVKLCCFLYTKVASFVDEEVH